MEKPEAIEYEPPALHELGKVHDLTEGSVQGLSPDFTFPHHPISV